MMRLPLLAGIFIIVRIVESPNNCKWFNKSNILNRGNWSFPHVCEIDKLTKLIISESNSHHFRDLKKVNWDHDAYWIYANTWTDLFMPSISNNLKEIGIDPIDVLNISDVIWMKLTDSGFFQRIINEVSKIDLHEGLLVHVEVNTLNWTIRYIYLECYSIPQFQTKLKDVLFINYTANLNLTGGRLKYISEVERQGDAFMSFASNNFIQLNVTVRNPYLLSTFHYYFVATVFPYVWQSGKLFADVKNVTSNLLLTLDLTKQVIGLEKFTILDIESIHVTLDNDLPIFDQFVSKVVNYLLPLYKGKIIQVSEETVLEEIYMRLNDINEIFFYS